jgi:hypothetical protein
MQWLTKLMYGRYGTDALGFFMLILVLILDVIFTFTGWDILYLFSFLLAVWCIWRIFSRNISRRYAENQKFMQVFSPVQNQNLRGKRPENTSAFSLSILQTENPCSTRKRKNPDYLPKMRTGVYQKILRADYLFLRYFGKMKFLSLSILF